jgi:LacI family transcriptional regulator
MFNPDERYNAYIKALEKNCIPLKRELICTGETSFESGYKLAGQMLEQNPGITALFLATNLMAVGAVQYIKERNIKIPDDLSVVVFDDYDWAKVHNPALTTIRQDAYGIGRKAAEILLGLLEKGPTIAAKKIYRFPMTLIERDSWGKPRGGIANE